MQVDDLVKWVLDQLGAAEGRLSKEAQILVRLLGPAPTSMQPALIGVASAVASRGSPDDGGTGASVLCAGPVPWAIAGARGGPEVVDSGAGHHVADF